MSYVLRRGGVAVTVLLAAVTLNFIVIRAAPGSYEDIFTLTQGASTALTDRDQQQLRDAYGLDKPLFGQFTRYLEETFTGNFGKSFSDGQPVRAKLWIAAKNSLSMVVPGVAAGILLGILLGIVSGVAASAWLDAAIITLALLIYSLPTQWVGMVLLALFAGTFPVGGREDPFATDSGFWAHQADLLWHMALPSLTLTLVTFGAFALVTRSSVRDVMVEDFIVMARAKGFSRTHIITHEVLRNAMLPVLALAALYVGFLFGGALLIEIVFSWPGLGSLAYNAISARDYPVIQATFLVLTVGIVVINFLADCLYGVLDPRVRSR